MAYSFSLVNGVTLLGQKALGLSAGLHGNGMCLSTRGLRRIPWKQHGLTEDSEYSWTVRIAGGRIAFDRDAVVYATMLRQGGGAAASQRQRWEHGRKQVKREMLRPLLCSPDLGPIEKIVSVIELTMPTNVSLVCIYLFLSIFVFSCLPRALARHEYPIAILIGVPHAVATLGLATHALSPFLLSFLPWRFGLSLAYFPFYAIWKILVVLQARPRTWVRTTREAALSVPSSEYTAPWNRRVSLCPPRPVPGINGRRKLDTPDVLPDAESSEPRRFFWLDASIFAEDLYPEVKVVYISMWPAFANRPDLEFLGEHLANKIRAIQPTGPYHLGGLCLSSLVAYEVARKLVASGHDVRLLAMLEPWKPGLDTFRRKLVQRLLLSLFRPTTLIPFVTRRLDGLGLRLRPSQPGEPEPSAEEQRVRSEFLKMRSRASEKAFGNSVMKPYPDRLTMIVGARSIQRFLVRGAWAPFALGGIDIHVLPGVHNDVFHENTYFISKIRECILQDAGESSIDGRSGPGSQSGEAAAPTDTQSNGQPATDRGVFCRRRRDHP